MNRKEFKSYKKELKHQPPLKRISSAITATKHVIGKQLDTDAEVAKFRKNRNVESLKKQLAEKMRG